MNTVTTVVDALAAQSNITDNNISPFPFLSFATHNVRSFTNPAKQHTLVELYSSLDIDVIGLQETNFSKNNVSPFQMNFTSKYVGFFGKQPNDNKQTTGFGVGLLLTPQLANHVFNHVSFLNRIILTDLQFSNKQKLRIINCYIPPADIITKKHIFTELFKILRSAISNNFHILLLGDFNADMDKPNLAKINKNFFDTIQNMNLFDSCSIIFDRLRVDYPTFRSHNATSRIDYVWSSVDIASHLLKCSTVDVPSTLTDHSIVILKCENFLNIKHNK
jgi:exonuclease III